MSKFVTSDQFEQQIYLLRKAIAGAGGGGGGSGVASFNGRTGAVTPTAGDYSAANVGAPALVNPSVNHNFVMFNSTAGLQVDSGVSAASFATAAHNHNTAYPALVNPSVSGNFVSFSGITGGQADSGSKAADFATAGHNHSGTYEPVLGNPASSGYALVSTTLGVRSWIAIPSVTGWLKADGTVALTANWNVGAFQIGINCTPGSPLSISGNATDLVAPLSGTLIHVLGDTGAVARMSVDAIANSGTFTCRRWNNTLASPTTMAANDSLFVFNVCGYNGTTMSAAKGAIYISAAEAWTTSANGTYMRFYTTPTGSTTQTEVVQILSSGQIKSLIATGTAPIYATSTTMCTNLNADLLDGSHASAFEPALGNPASGGYVLSSTAAGVRSWVAAGGSGEPALGNPGVSGMCLKSTTGGTRSWGYITPAEASFYTSSGGINTTETVILKSAVAIPANTFQIGSAVRITLKGTFTDTVARANTFRIRFGVNGTTADTQIASVAMNGGGGSTNNPFRIVIEFVFGTVGASGSIIGWATVVPEASGAGIYVNGYLTKALTVAAPNTTTANYIDVTFASAAADSTATFQGGFIEILKV